MAYPQHVQIPPLFSDFLVSAARARGALSVRKRRAIFTLHSNRNTNLFRFIRLFIRLPSRYCSLRSFRIIAVCNPVLFAFRPEAFPTNEYRLTDYS